MSTVDYFGVDFEALWCQVCQQQFEALAGLVSHINLSDRHATQLCVYPLHIARLFIAFALTGDMCFFVCLWYRVLNIFAIISIV